MEHSVEMMEFISCLLDKSNKEIQKRKDFSELFFNCVSYHNGLSKIRSRGCETKG